MTEILNKLWTDINLFRFLAIVTIFSTILIFTICHRMAKQYKILLERYNNALSQIPSYDYKHLMKTIVDNSARTQEQSEIIIKINKELLEKINTH